jgi:hypothetical protein
VNQLEVQIKKIKSSLTSGKALDISLANVQEQYKLFLMGVKTPNLVKPCTVGDGIIKLDNIDYPNLLDNFYLTIAKERLIKFVPASGAASRMFQKLQSVLNRFQTFTLQDLKTFSESDKDCKGAYEFLTNLKKFAFYDELKFALSKDDNEIESLIRSEPSLILNTILSENEMNYAHKPKGAIKFHKYKNEIRTAFEEQLFELFYILIDKKTNLKIHFTISEEHTKLFLEIIRSVKPKIERNGSKLLVDYSYQKKSTNTIAVDLENNILFDGSCIVLRPAGHGALLENLNDLKADIIIIKNIDNVSTERFAAESILFNKLLVGLLVTVQNKIFEFLRMVESRKSNPIDYEEIFNFCGKYLAVVKPSEWEEWNDYSKKEYFFNKLNRPLRVCGMVKNQGDPGGGPFWLKNEKGDLSLQIVEQAQINFNDENQKKIFSESTYFNPVNIVCAVKDYKGNNFNLLDFRDSTSGVISIKSKNGFELKALELPGLWNGSMANWNTIFVEVPISTFNPVKEVNDLLKPAHQN